MTQPPKRSPRPSQHGPAAVPAAPGRLEVQRAMALRDVMQHVVEVETEVAKRAGPGTFRGRMLALSALFLSLTGVSAYSWIARPEFIWGPRPDAAPVAVQEAGVRFGMYLFAQRIEAYRKERGTLPPSLQEIEDAPSDLMYETLSDSTFVLRQIFNHKMVQFRSDDSVDGFLGSSPEIIMGHEK